MNCHLLETLHVDRNDIEYVPSGIDDKPNLKDFMISTCATYCKNEKARGKLELKVREKAEKEANKIRKSLAGAVVGLDLKEIDKWKHK